MEERCLWYSPTCRTNIHQRNYIFQLPVIPMFLYRLNQSGLLELREKVEMVANKTEIIDRIPKNQYCVGFAASRIEGGRKIFQDPLFDVCVQDEVDDKLVSFYSVKLFIRELYFKQYLSNFSHP